MYQANYHSIGNFLVLVLLVSHKWAPAKVSMVKWKSMDLEIRDLGWNPNSVYQLYDLKKNNLTSLSL